MNTKKIERWLLLEQTGELSPRKLRNLNFELAASEDVRRLRDELSSLSGAVIKDAVEPDPWTLTKITARLRAEKAPRWSFSRALKPVLTLSICLFMTTRLLNFHESQTPSGNYAGSVAVAEADALNDPFEVDMAELENLILAISGDQLDIMEM
jgi:hypothetical protein